MIGHELDPQPVLRLLSRCPKYASTPMEWFRSVYLKDERDRMGLGSFKALGGAYVVAEHALSEPEKKWVFSCASAGNHGLSVAAGARAFGCVAVVFLARTVPDAFERRILETGARVVRAGETYEESMSEARERSSREGWTLISDSSWKGYTAVPRLVMEGYTVIAWEMERDFSLQGEWPSHLYLQAGVGGLAAAVTFRVRHHWPVQPTIVVVEPEAAPCLRESHLRGEPTSVSGPASNMGRLDCKEPSLLAFDILHQHADDFITVSDEDALEAVELLGAGGYETTPSGAAGYAGALRHAPDGSVPCVILTEASSSSGSSGPGGVAG